MKAKIKTAIVIVAITLLSALASVSLAEQPQHILSVHVVDNAGTPIPWGIVNFRQEQEDKNYVSIGWQKVDKNGIASMTVPEGVYSVVASATGNPVGIGENLKVSQDKDVYLSFYMKLGNN